MTESPSKRGKFPFIVLFVQVIFIVLYLLYTDYGMQAQPYKFHQLSISKTFWNITHHEEKPSGIQQVQSPTNESMFQDTFFFIVSAFSLMYCFLCRHNFSSIAGGIFVTAISAQWGMLCKGFFYTSEYPIRIDVLSLLGGIGEACLILVSWGAVIGKLSPLQLTIMTLLEVPLAVAMEYVILIILQVKDVGGSMICHEFGAYFGVGVAFALQRQAFEERDVDNTTPTSAFRCLIGTMIFWIFWPTCIAAPLSGPVRYLALINVYMAMLGSCITAFVLTSILDKDGKFDIGHIQNATIAGGVAVGTTADALLGPGCALIIGAAGAIVTILGMDFLQPVLTSKLHIHDSAGVHNLHGLVGILGGTVGALVAGIASENVYGLGLYIIYPSMAPRDNSSEFQILQEIMPDVVPGLGRSSAEQAGYQVIAIVLCCLAPLFAGSLTGLVLRSSFLESPSANQLYSDIAYWKIPTSGEENSGDIDSIKSISKQITVSGTPINTNAVGPM